MIHKIGNFNDTLSLPPMTQAIKSLILSNVNLLCEHYGCNRDTDNDDGGIILYCPKGTAEDELKKLKELLDMGIVTQEEFDAKKKQLLGL